MVREVSRQSWGGRLGNSLKGILIGFILFGAGLWLLWWNEGRALETYKTLNEVRDNVTSIQSDTVSNQNDGKAIHVTGKAVTPDILTDPLFEVSSNAIRLRRRVEMYQWRENRSTNNEKKMGGSTETITEYSYEKVWSERLIDSSGFRQASKHVNPSTMQPGSWSDFASSVSMGSFRLSPAVVRELTFFESLPLSDVKLPEEASLDGDVIKIGSTGSVPDIGDKRITFEVVPQGEISVIASQRDADLVPWVTSSGKEYLRVQSGTHTAVEMMDQAEAEAKFLTWLIRLGGWLALTIGMTTILKPLSVLGDVVPFIGNLIGGSIFIISAITCAAIALITIAIAWIATRPMIGFPILIVAFGLIGWVFWRSRSQNKAQVA